MERRLITSALPYANGYIHLGHCAGAYLPADIYARFLRLKGEEVLYICGSDEHGVAITIAAEKEKVSPQEIIDKYHYANKEAFETFGMSFDNYSRTSIELHHKTAREFFGDFIKKGYLIDMEEEQFYDSKAQMFLPDRYVEGICPNCGAERARGDQCDSCGAYYDQLELKNPISLVSGTTPEVRKTVHWYMRFDMFQAFLEKYIESNESTWKENVIQQTKSWLKKGLTHRAITRDLNWGVNIDGIEGVQPQKAYGKVLYVWFDAVLGYISSTKELQDKLRQQNPESIFDWRNWWQNPETDYVAFIGKDNIVFHTLIFPAMLNGRGENYILPKNVPANEFLNLEGQKLSKSRNWSIDLKDYIKDFPSEQMIDTLRYGLAMSFPETKDSDFTWKDFQARNNNELAAILGNFVNRSLTFVHKYFEGKVPKFSNDYKWIAIFWRNIIEYFEFKGHEDESILKEVPYELKKLLTDNDVQLIYALWQGLWKINKNYENFRFRDAITETMNVARAANKYFNDEEPWKTAKSDIDKCGKTIFVCVQLVNALSRIFAPILPHVSKKISYILNVPSYTGEAQFGKKEEDRWFSIAYPQIENGVEINETEILFTKLEDDVIKQQIEKLGKEVSDNEAEEAEAEEKVEEITFDDFTKIQLKTAKILEAEKVKKSKKLIKLIVDLGREKRQILAGVAEHYQPEDLLGKTIIVVANLKPAKLMGIESQGMMLAASNKEGKLCFVTPAEESIGVGAEVR
jgi:methionyl-tRNA synthetase